MRDMRFSVVLLFARRSVSRIAPSLCHQIALYFTGHTCWFSREQIL
jgi:hypothetical protein